MASVEAADSLAQNRPSGTRIGCDEYRERCCVQRRKVQRPERLVPRQNEIKEQRRGKPWNGHRRQHINEFTSDGRTIHPRRFQDILRDFLEIREEHPDHDRQIAETEDHDETSPPVEQPEIPIDQINRNQHADRGHHLGREHPEQDVLGALGRRERHRPGRRNSDDHRNQRRPACNEDRIDRMMNVVAALLHRRVVLSGPVKQQEFWWH